MDFFWGNEPKKLYNILHKYEFICFDIFDTLIKRNVATPEEVFSLVEKEYNSIHSQNINNFFSMRINAEKKARKASHYYEIMLTEIYNELPLPNNIREELMKIEVNMELALCVPNPMILPVYYRLINEGKKVFIVSDMYLPYEDIKRILNKCGVLGYHSLYISSQYRCQKKMGFLTLYLERKV